MEVTLRILGCGDAFCSGGRANTSFYVSSPEINFLIDCGATTLLALKKYQIPTQEIDMIIISHMHGDHFGGLVFFLLEEKKNKRKKPICIVCPVGMDEKVKQAVELYYPGSSTLSELDIRYVFFGSHQTLNLEKLRIESFPVVHSQETLPHGLRVTVGNKVIAYSGDTEWTDELYPLSDNADLFICECNYYLEEGPNHISYTTLKKKQLNCKKLLLTHMGDEMLENADSVDFDMAEDGLEIRLP
ncbi:MBL fold metallo-hydrolase [Litoribacter ruber]|uniref:MBL fold metallo-hydrolase n=1 Tax=Litoribacter ruber TaxID=702568 RepID=A0AAP2G5D7_9BACT|nr:MULTISPECIES: MBL fold metallo-hydrolase [Litoribacter]MBS9525425.1 MBL fold metallo-hydrolase [Litoribacter alkaliphilus]MBT0810512.1 MBL fold metallo-hydrolase [Litoribacter ruber]